MAPLQHKPAGADFTLDFRLVERQLDFDIRFYETILLRNPTNVDVLRQLVELLAQQGDYEQALQLDRRLVALRPLDRFAHYNLACTLSVLGQIMPALKALEDCFALGYDDVAHMEADSDLDALQQHPGYFKLLRRFGLAI
jgi:adenylate cyclase